MNPPQNSKCLIGISKTGNLSQKIHCLLTKENKSFLWLQEILILLWVFGMKINLLFMMDKIWENVSNKIYHLKMEEFHHYFSQHLDEELFFWLVLTMEISNALNIESKNLTPKMKKNKNLNFWSKWQINFKLIMLQ